MNTPAGMPARSARTPRTVADKRRFGCRARDKGAACGQRGCRLAGDHRVGKVPGRDRGRNPDGLLDDGDALVALVAGNGLAIDALGLFAEELDESWRHRRSRPWPRPAACPCSAVRMMPRSSWFSIIRSNHLRSTAARSLPVQLRPFLLRGFGLGDGPGHLRAAQVGHLGDHVAACGVGHLERAVVAIRPIPRQIGLVRPAGLGP